jgi:hypothetical protein
MNGTAWSRVCSRKNSRGTHGDMLGFGATALRQSLLSNLPRGWGYESPRWATDILMKTDNPEGIWQNIPVRPYSLIGNIVEKTDGTRVAITPLPYATLVAFPQSEIPSYPTLRHPPACLRSLGCDL